MAKVKNQSIPPSIRDQYARILSLPGYTGGEGKTVGLSRSARQAQPEPIPNALLTAIISAGRWLRSNWPRSQRPAESGDFKTNRLEELRAGFFDPRFWYELTATEDLTDYGTPEISIYAGDLNKAWFDETRHPSICRFARASSTYPTPTGPGTTQQPRPGWQGTVSNGVWRDLWFAQRRLTYTLPQLAYRPGLYNYERPLFAVITGQVSAQANFRGYAPWFSLCSWPYLYHATNSPPAEPDYLITKWVKDYEPRMIVPPAVVSDWQYTLDVSALRTLNGKASFGPRVNANRLMLRITTPPSRGVYFERNDNVRVSHTETVKIYQGKGWNG